MVEFKAHVDKTIKERWGIEVEHVRGKLTYEQAFYRVLGGKKRPGEIYGWPFPGGPYCNSDVKMPGLDKVDAKGNIIYLGIAVDEPNRFHSLSDSKRSPLVEPGWTEADCRRWCEENDLLSPIYTTATRGGCWFCHNQGVNQLRLLRKDYPELWALMLKWDKDSPVTFKPGYRDRNGIYHDGKTVHDYEERFQLEDSGLIYLDENFRWTMIEDGGVNYRLF